MIAVRLMGGLGNQMFQYATARNLAISHDTSVLLDLESFSHESDTPRYYELDCFNIQAGVLADKNRPYDNPEVIYTGKIGGLRKIKHHFEGRNWRYFRERPDHMFDPKVLKQPDHTYLFGFWQSERYFTKIRGQLLQDFSFKKPADGKNKEVLKQIQSTNSVSMHVRRGDYVTNPTYNKYHGTKGKDHYQAGLSILIKTVRNPTLFIFSDDPAWCKKNMKFDYPTTYVENKKGFEDMRLVSNCKHNILANSSFSWWGAWLNQNPQKIVIAPKVWFLTPTHNTKDLIPRTWLQI